MRNAAFPLAGLWDSRALSVNRSPANSARFGESSNLCGIYAWSQAEFWVCTRLCCSILTVLCVKARVILTFPFTCCSLIPVSPFTCMGAHGARSCRLMWKWSFWDMCWLVWTIFSSAPFLDANLAMVTDKLLELCSWLIFSVYGYSVNMSELSLW